MPHPDPPKSPETPEQRRARIQRILREVEKKLEQSLPDLDQPLEQIEQQVVEIGREVREIIERDTLASGGTGYAGSQASCRCGASARFVTLLARSLITLNGVHRVSRAYYHCAPCRQGFCPLDAHLGIGRGETSVGVRALCARFSSYLPFRKAAEELALVCGVRLAAGTVRRAAEGVGQAIAAEWAQRERALWAGEAPPPAERPSQLQVGMDGVYIRIGTEWKEVKVGEVFRPVPGGGVTRITYYATRAEADRFGRRMRTVAQREGMSFCRAQATVGDGADWIWQEAGKHFPRSEEILDYYHALQYLWEVAHARCGEGLAAREWIDRQQKRLLEEPRGVKAVIREVEKWTPASSEPAEVRRRVVNYLRTHAPRMEYQRLRALGYHIGSGGAEAGCKNVVQARLKGTGMRWSEGGAEAMLHLRAAWCSTHGTDFRAAARTMTSVS